MNLYEELLKEFGYCEAAIRAYFKRRYQSGSVRLALDTARQVQREEMSKDCIKWD